MQITYTSNYIYLVCELLYRFYISSLQNSRNAVPFFDIVVINTINKNTTRRNTVVADYLQT